jgi:hypothetical protein|nr:MAG TPA: hypothetical protein [Caudoviricetes sp.]
MFRWRYHFKLGGKNMNLEQAKTRKTQLEREVEVAKEEIYTFSIDKSKLEQQAQNLQDKIEFKSRDLNTKQQEINTLATAIEVMER